MPESPLSGYKIKLFGSDNLQTVDLEGNIHTPLIDTVVNLIYKAVSIIDPDEYIVGNFNVNILIKGQYIKNVEDNTEPIVLPSLREWKGTQGKISLAETSRIVVNSYKLIDKAKILHDNIKDMLGLNLKIIIDEPNDNDIYLSLTDKNPELGNEGYYLEVGKYVSVNAYSLNGISYGGISLIQIAYQSESKCALPCGIARDYPKYIVRSAHLDVARAWINMDYLSEITKYCAWYKINDLHLHINDWGGNGYEAFRLENNFKGLAADDGYYTKDEYREFQKIALTLGINIVTEIDTPAHATSFQRIMPEIPILSWSYLDITSPQTLASIKQLLDEYLDGDDPVFASHYVDIGTDEFPREYGEYMRVYIAELLKYIRSKEFTPRLWALFGGDDSYDGNTTVKGYAQASYAVPLMQDSQTLMDYGYDIINAIQLLYIVPGGPFGYADYMDIKYLYNHWEANYYSYDGASKELLGHPQFAGAMFCLWNDLYTTNSGFSIFDIFNRFKDGVMLISEKTWYGEKRSDQTADDFTKKIEVLSKKVPLVNPSRLIDSKNDIIIDVNFENCITDNSENAYNINLINTELESQNDNTYLKFNGNGYISLPFDSVGFPYTISFDLYLNGIPAPDTTLFDGKDGTLYLNIDNTRKIGFRRGIYTFIYDFSLPVGQWYNIKLTCDSKDTILIANNKYKFIANNQKYSNESNSTTFVLPVEQIGKGFIGAIDNILILKTNTDTSLYDLNYNIDNTSQIDNQTKNVESIIISKSDELSRSLIKKPKNNENVITFILIVITLIIFIIIHIKKRKNDRGA
ncbi:MAG: hypothetical protein A2Y17_06530 [Clostridiales bacterium GWF2_38_85]|nr:MAG: hypothetical protein A2Y17_06530 [Clostridiales bacterium GWF2_38_85]